MLVLARGLLPYPYQGPCQRQPASTKTWNRKHPAMNSDCSYKSILAIPFFRVLFQFPANIEIKWTKNLWMKSKCPKPFCRKVVNNDGKKPKVGYLLFWRARITLCCRTLLCIAVHSRSSLHWSATLAARASGKLRRSSLVGLVGWHHGWTGGSRGTCGKAKKSASGTGDGNETHCKRNSLPVN